eukprot:g5081.t1
MRGSIIYCEWRGLPSRRVPRFFRVWRGGAADSKRGVLGQMRHPTKTAADVKTALIEFVVAQTTAGQGNPVPASRIGGSFLSRPGYRAALLGTGERLMPYLSRTFSLWKDSADDQKPVNQREIYVAHAKANFPPSRFACMSRPEGVAVGARRAGRAQDKSPDKPASAKKENQEARSKDPPNSAAKSVKKKNAPPSKSSKLPKVPSSIDPGLRRYVKNAIKLNGFVSVSKVGGAFLSHNQTLRKMLKDAKKKLPDYLSTEYSLWKMRSELNERKPSEQEVYVAARDAWLAPTDFVLLSRPHSDNAADTATTFKIQTSTVQPTAKGAHKVATTTTRQKPDQGDVESRVCRFVNTRVSEAGSRPVLALKLVCGFIKEHPTLCNSKSGGRLLLMIRDNFSLWQKSVPQCKDLFDGDVFVANADTDSIHGFTLISRPEQVPSIKAKPPSAESSSSNTKGNTVADSPERLNFTPPGSPDAGSQRGSSPLVDSKLSSPTPLNYQSQGKPQKVFAYEGATFSNAASENLHNPWSFTVRKYYESDATVKLTDALLATDLTRKDLAQSIAALLAHFRQQGSFELFRDVSNHIHSKKLSSQSEH